MVRAVPRQIGALDIARLDARHFRIIISLRSGWPVSARGNGYFFCGPLPVVPLPDESAPVLNVELDTLAACFQGGFLIPIERGIWLYAATAAAPAGERLTLTATAQDRPGNTATGTVAYPSS